MDEPVTTPSPMMREEKPRSERGRDRDRDRGDRGPRAERAPQPEEKPAEKAEDKPAEKAPA
jgi:hypothetical protein